jgi:uncharacterized membrane protein YeaQ/YmgE (transglycosylase-associated protein family)
MINFIIWLIVGAISGWLAALVTSDQEGMLRNILVGMIGAFSGCIAFNLFGKDGPSITMNVFSVSSVMVALVCAGTLLGIVNLFRYSWMRDGSVR